MAQPQTKPAAKKARFSAGRHAAQPKPATKKSTVKKSPAKKSPAKKTPSRKQPPRGAAPTKHAAANGVTFHLDNTTSKRWFTDSPDLELRGSELTEADLIARALALAPGYTLDRLAREGTLLRAQRLIAAATYASNAGDAVGSASRGKLGAADARLAEAIGLCKKENIKLTPARVGARANPPVGLRTSKAYFVRMGLPLEPTEP